MSAAIKCRRRYKKPLDGTDVTAHITASGCGRHRSIAESPLIKRRMPMVEETGKIQFHEGFYGAVKARYSWQNDFTFLQELELGNGPLRVDMLIIKHNADDVLKDDIGQFFKTYNVIEYKSPEDSLSVDDFYKAQGYASIYKGLDRRVDEIPIEDLAVSIFRHSYPRKMFERLKQSKMQITEKYPGVYYITGALCVQTQVIVTSKLKKDTYPEFKLLAKGFRQENVEQILTKARQVNDPKYTEYIKSVMDVAIAIDKQIFDEIKKEADDMNKAVESLFEKEFAEREAEGRAEGRAEGKAEGRAEGEKRATLNNVRNLMANMKLTLDRAMDVLSIPDSERAALKVALAQVDG